MANITQVAEQIRSNGNWHAAATRLRLTVGWTITFAGLAILLRDAAGFVLGL